MALNPFLLYSSLYLLLRLASASEFTFNPLIQLPSCGLHTNSSEACRPVVLNINDFGAKGDGVADDTKSLEDVWKIACALPTRSTIVIPAGRFYLIRPVDFAGPCQSKVTLKVSGLIIAPRDPAVWHGWNVRKWLYFRGVKNLKIEGRGGVINGMGHEWWARSCKTNDSYPCRHAPNALTFHRCNNLKIRNLTLINSQQMHMAFTNCNRVMVTGVSIMAPEDSPNTDGIHISASTLVELKDIAISTGDDCVSIVTNSSAIRITNVFCSSGHGISIGSLGKRNSCDSVMDVLVDGAVFFNTKNGVRIKTWQGGSGWVRRIAFKNIWMKNVVNPIIIDQYYCDSRETCINQTSAVKVDGVSFIDISGTSGKEEAISFACSDDHPCRRLYLENVHLSTSDGTAKSFCWEAYGMSSGEVYPPSCLSAGEIVIRHRVKPNSTSLRRDDLAVF